MSGKAPSQAASSLRYDRCKQIIDTCVAHDHFRLDFIKELCAQEHPSFVTRLVNELEQKGWVVKEEEGNCVAYRWNAARGEFSADDWLQEKIHGAQVKSAPKSERPRERLLAQGAEKLKTSELLAILIRSGRPGESATAAGEKISKQFDGRLEDLAAAGQGELKSISSAVSPTAFCQIMAGIELGRRVAALSDDTITHRITSSQEAIQFCQNHFARLASDAKQEEFHIVSLDTKNHVIDTHQITVGTLNASLVHPREVFRPAIKDAASSIILVHNHPSGDPTPSAEDHSVTRRLEQCGETLGIDVLDHIVLGTQRAVSLRETE